MVSQSVRKNCTLAKGRPQKQDHCLSMIITIRCSIESTFGGGGDERGFWGQAGRQEVFLGSEPLSLNGFGAIIGVGWAHHRRKLTDHRAWELIVFVVCLRSNYMDWWPLGDKRSSRSY